VYNFAAMRNWKASANRLEIQLAVMLHNGLGDAKSHGLGWFKRAPEKIVFMSRVRFEDLGAAVTKTVKKKDWVHVPGTVANHEQFSQFFADMIHEIVKYGSLKIDRRDGSRSE
jgi:hypothetical protein